MTGMEARALSCAMVPQCLGSALLGVPTVHCDEIQVLVGRLDGAGPNLPVLLPLVKPQANLAGYGLGTQRMKI